MGDAFAAGLGIAMGLLMSQYLVQAMTLQKALVKVVCPKCAARSPVEYSYCSSCGQRLHPLYIRCRKCQAKNPASMNYCGTCGVPLKVLLSCKNHMYINGSNKA